MAEVLLCSFACMLEMTSPSVANYHRLKTSFVDFRMHTTCTQYNKDTCSQNNQRKTLISGYLPLWWFHFCCTSRVAQHDFSHLIAQILWQWVSYYYSFIQAPIANQVSLQQLCAVGNVCTFLEWIMNGNMMNGSKMYRLIH